ncbi:MAG: hypothetical protein O2782_08920 [bacterium]|nr:hypothetical protein [bacterium]
MIATPASVTTHAIHDLRERLLTARCGNDRTALPGLIDSLRILGRSGYRCCLVDFDQCRPLFYVRLLGYEKTRVAAELEFPIEPRLSRLQHVPLSHLIDYDEAEPQRIRSIYHRLAPYLHQRRVHLRPAPAADHRRMPCGPPARVDDLAPPSMAAWWIAAALLFISSLVVFVVA